LYYLAPHNRSFVQPNPTSTTNHLPPIPPNTKTPSNSPPNRSSSKKTRATADTQPRKSTTTNKGNKIKTSSNTALATSGATTKRSTANNNIKKSKKKPNHNTQMMGISTGLSAKPPITTPKMSTNKKTMKSVTDAVISYLHYKGGGAAGGEHSTGRMNIGIYL
jgi:hypothetical protein